MNDYNEINEVLRVVAPVVAIFLGLKFGLRFLYASCDTRPFCFDDVINIICEILTRFKNLFHKHKKVDLSKHEASETDNGYIGFHFNNIVK